MSTAMNTLACPTLVDRVLPSGGAIPGWARDVLLVSGGAALTALSAQVVIPMLPVPMTGQTFAVLLCGAAMGWKRGAASQIAYLTAGIAGAPIMAEGMPGLVALAGPTAGYLLAFPLAAALTGVLSERGWDRRVWSTALAMVLGMLVIYACGLAGLTRFVEGSKLLATGLLPFIPGDLVKVAIAAALLPSVWGLTGRGNRPA